MADLSNEQLTQNFADIAPALTPDYALLEADARQAGNAPQHSQPY